MDAREKLTWLVYAATPVAIIGRQACLRFRSVDASWGQTQLLTLFALAAAVHLIVAFGSVRGSIAAITVMAVTYAAEWLGTNTGLIFGDYRYTAALGEQVGGVPWSVPVAWFALSYAAWWCAMVVRDHQPSTRTPFQDELHGRRFGDATSTDARSVQPRFGDKTIVTVIMTAALMVLWDLAMDLNQVHEGRWRWENDGFWFGIPLSNFLGWFVISLLAATTFEVILRPAGVRHPAIERTRWLPAAFFLMIVGLAATKTILTGNVAAGALVGAVWVIVTGAAVWRGWRRNGMGGETER